MRYLTIGLLFTGFAMLAASSSAADDFKPEPGFTMLLNGKNLDGWKLKGKKDGAEIGDKSEASGGRFKVVEGVLVIDPKVKGDITILIPKHTVNQISGSH